VGFHWDSWAIGCDWIFSKVAGQNAEICHLWPLKIILEANYESEPHRFISTSL